MSTILPLNKIIYSDCLQGMKSLPDNCADCCVTDPPYGWKFMGKKWDYEIPTVEIWQEVYRVLKPGAHILVACGTRTQHRMAVNIEDAGFEIRDVISWHYGSGFPKSLDISKAIDKAAGAEREITGEKITGRANAPRSEGRNHVDCAGGQMTIVTTAPSTEAAKQWSGWGTALKPATEFWTLARKPLSENTIAANVIKHCTGGLNIEACRIEVDPNDPNIRDYKNHERTTGSIWDNAKGADKNLGEKGRFPANVILDEFMAAEMDKQSGLLTSGTKKSTYIAKESQNKSMSGKNYERPMMDRDGDTGGGIPLLLRRQAIPRRARQYYPPNRKASNPHTIPDQTYLPYRTRQDRLRPLCWIG